MLGVAHIELHLIGQKKRENILSNVLYILLQYNS